MILRDVLEAAIYDDPDGLGVDPERVDREQGVAYLVACVQNWLDTDETREKIYEGYVAEGMGGPMHGVASALQRWAEEGLT